MWEMLLLLLVLIVLIHEQGAYQYHRFHLVLNRCGKGARIGGQLNLARKDSDEIDSLKIDPSQLTEEQKQRFSLIEKLNQEADEFARLGGLLPNDDDEGKDESEEVTIPISETTWSGQSNVEISRVSTQNSFDLVNRPFLAGGDILAFLLFAAIGRSRHSEGIDLFAVIETAAPFLLPWLVISPFLGSYSRDATASQGKIAIGILPGWVLSLASGFLIRYFEKGYPPPTPFMIVSAITTFALLYGWRSLYIAAVGATTEDDQKKAGFFEVFKMISTLVRRW